VINKLKFLYKSVPRKNKIINKVKNIFNMTKLKHVALKNVSCLVSK